MYVSTILKDKGNRVVTIDPQASAREAAKIMEENKIGAVVVVGDGAALIGILSERDIVRGVAIHGDRALGMPVRALMTPHVITCRPDDTVQSMMELMTGRRFRHVPVVDGDVLLGIISIGDVVKNRLEECSLEVDSLRHYVVSSR